MVLDTSRVEASVTQISFRGPLEGFTHFGASGVRGDGPYAYLWFDVREGVIRRAGYLTPGCPASSMLGEVLCRLAIGRPMAMLATLTASELIAVAGPVPEGRGFYAQMFIHAVKAAAFEESQS